MIIDTVNHDHRYNTTPDDQKQKLEETLKRVATLSKKNRLLRTSQKRAQKTAITVKDLLLNLQKKQYLSEGLSNFKGLEDTPLQLFERMQSTIVNGVVSREKYPEKLRCFALTLNFYSPKAYEYVRKEFKNALPHPSVIRGWFNTVDAEPGFSEECFNSLQLHAQEYREKNKKFVCALMMDEMGIKEGFQRSRNGVVRGYVDMGIKEPNNLRTATDALVLMVVPLNDVWKLPIGFFFINGLTAESKANLIKNALQKLCDAGVEIASLTLDGPKDHLSAVKKLGAVMGIGVHPKPYFPHPTEGQPSVNVILDPCHDLKNIRNALEFWQVIFDGNDKRIEWRFIRELALLQEQTGLRLGNRLRETHINFKKMIMKVFLAAQTLSASVADAIEFCWETLRLRAFKGCEPTVRFIRCIDCIFDFLNVRNPLGKGFKSSLRKNNEHIWRPRILNEINYLKQLKLSNNQPIYLSARNTGFIGFYTAVISTLAIFDKYVKPIDAPLKMLMSYKFSQDHLELFFAAIRAKGGWCPNPTAAQFIAAYKRLLVRHDIKIATGNCRMMEETRILHVGSSKKKCAKINRYDLDIYNAVDNQKVLEKYIDIPREASHQNSIKETEEFLNFTWAIPEDLNEFSTHAVEYIAGFVVRKISSIIKCTECVLGCMALSNESQDQNIYTHVDNALILKKSRGGLIIPSRSVVTICTTTERLFRRACKYNHGKPPVEKNFPAVLANAVNRDMLVMGKNDFTELGEHFLSTFRLDDCVDHKIILTSEILKQYIEIRMYALTKSSSLHVTGTKLRHFLTRQIIWAHQ